MGGHPLRSPTDRSFGGPLPRQLANRTRAYPWTVLLPIKSETCDSNCYGVLGGVSTGYPPTTGKLLTRYAPFRRSPTGIATLAAPRLACVKPAASVHPEPGSNSSWYIFYYASSLSRLNQNQEINALESPCSHKDCCYLSCTCLPDFSMN